MSWRKCKKRQHIPQIDISILEQPLEIGQHGNIAAITKIVNDGTPEIRNLLVNECDIIFECRICRALFRSIANLLTHKRHFCTKTFNEVNLAQMANSIEEENNGQKESRNNADSNVISEKIVRRAVNAQKISQDRYPIRSNKNQNEKDKTTCDGKGDMGAEESTSKTAEDETIAIEDNSEEERAMSDSEVEEEHSEADDKEESSMVVVLKRMHGSVNVDMDSMTCLTCEVNFSNKYHLSEHLREIHDAFDIYHVCPMCQIICEQIHQVMKHLWVYHDLSKDRLLELKPTVVNRVQFKRRDWSLETQSRNGIQV